MEFIILFALIFVVVLYCMIRGAIEEKRQKQKYREHLLHDYGKYEIKSYTPEQMKTISRLFLL